MRSLLVFIILFFAVWDVAWWVIGVKPLFPWQLKAQLRTHPSQLILLDVRTPPEYNWFRLPGAQNIPDLLMGSSKMPPVSPTQEVVVICMTGHRSPFVAHTLKKRGFTRVYNLTWGMLGWKMYEWVSRVRNRLA
jgi:rhodanese-related sulfurtransferase